MNESNTNRWLRLLNYVLVAAIASAVTLMCSQGFPVKHDKLDELEELILNSYIGEADSTTLHDGAAAGMIAATGDRWSYYIPASQMQSYENGKKNSYVGIGVSIAAEDMSQGLEVLTVDPAGGAAQAGILPGDLVVVHRQQTAYNGEIVVALLDDEATVKRLSRKNGETWLLPENDAYQPIDGTHASLLGKVTAVVRQYS